MEKSEIFQPQNLNPNSIQFQTSPCGKYSVEIQTYQTEKGCWNYTRGILREGDRVIHICDRNYGAYHPSHWIQHPNGHLYYVCSEDYQGQTIVECCTGRVRTVGEKDNGYGFCWVDAELEPNTLTLVVSGCFWACPYEFMLYDFTDPIESGWGWLEHPALETQGIKTVPNYRDGVFVHETYKWDPNVKESPEDPEDTEGWWGSEPQERITIKRNGDHFDLVDHWVDPQTQAQRDESEKRWAEMERWLKEDLPTIEPWRTMLNYLADKDWGTEKSLSHRGKELVCKRVAHRKNGITADIDLKMGDSIELDTYLNGSVFKLKEPFPATIEGMVQALNTVKELIGTQTEAQDQS